MNKEKYFKQIEKRKFTKASYFRKVGMAINTKKTNAFLYIVKSDNDFNEYISPLNDVDENNYGYLLTPMRKITLNKNLLEIFDIYILDLNLTIKQKLDENTEIKISDRYFNNILFLKKNISVFYNIKIEDKINLFRI